MIRLQDASIRAARTQAIGAGLVATFDGSALQATRDPATGDVRAVDPKGRPTQFCFDRQGFVGAVVSPLGRRWELESDPKGRPRRFTDPAGGRLDLAYDPAGQLVRIGRGDRDRCAIDYDERGEVTAYRFPDGTATRLDRDPSGRITRMTDRLGAARTFDHTPDGLLATMTDGRGHATRFDYEELDRPSRITAPDGTVTTFEYDSTGQPSAIEAPDGTRVVITRDAQGRPTRIDAGDGQISRFTYDDQGRTLRAENPTAVIDFTYDADGRLIAESRGDEVVQYLYDEVGTLVALVYPTGERVSFGRDADLRLTEVVDWAGGVTQFDHAADDRWLTIRAPNGLITALEMAVDGQVAEWGVRTPLRPSVAGRGLSGGEDLIATSYRYDAEDHLGLAIESAHGERPYRYDAEGRLLAAGSESFAYDAVGNRIQAGGESAEFDAADQLISQGSIRCDYDPRGNLVGWSEPAGTWEYAYDGLNRMTRAASRSGLVVTFGYDAFGRRVWKRSGDVTTRFFWAGEQLIREVRSDGTARDYLYPPGASTPLAIRDGGVTYAVHADHLGTPRRMTDPSGEVVWSADLDAFGRARVAVATVANPFRFAGHYHDAETGLHDNRFRSYSPRLGRYLSRDPAGYLGGLNLYAYAGNDPINAVDPLGLWPSWRTILPIVAAIAVGVAVVVLAPVALPAAIILAGAAAGAVGAGLNQGLNEETFCAECIAKAALKGALVGTLAAIPFALLPVSAGVAAFAGVGALSGGISSVADHFVNPGTRWSWKNFATSVALGAVTAGAGRYLGGRYAQFRQGETPPTKISPQTEGKILYGDQAVNPKTGAPTQRVIGGHSPDIVNQPEYAVTGKLANGDEVTLPNSNAVTNPDGTRNVQFVKEHPDGTLSSNVKNSTLAPEDWSNQKIMDTTQQVGDSPALGTRAHDGATWHRQTVDGVQWEVIKDSGGNVTSSYPTGGGAPPLGGFTPTPPYPVPPVAGPTSVGTTTTTNQGNHSGGGNP